LKKANERSSTHANKSSSAGAFELDELNAAAQRSLKHIKNKIAVISGKGGVGKSFIASSLAIALAQRDFKVGLMDVDLHGPSIPKMLGLKQGRLGSEEGLMTPVKLMEGLSVVSIGFLLQSEDDAVIWRGPLKISAIKQFIGQVKWGNLDYLVIDLPPGTGDEPLSIAQAIPDARAVIVTTPQEISLSDVRKCISFTRRLNIPLAGVIENMSGLICPHCGAKIEPFKSGGGEGMARETGVPFLGRLPMDLNIVAACDEGRIKALFYDDNEPSRAFNKIVDEIVKSA
jgi:Mrp family chromosome partitioning ATPase